MSRLDKCGGGFGKPHWHLRKLTQQQKNHAQTLTQTYAKIIKTTKLTKPMELHGFAETPRTQISRTSDKITMKQMVSSVSGAAAIGCPVDGLVSKTYGNTMISGVGPSPPSGPPRERPRGGTNSGPLTLNLRNTYAKTASGGRRRPIFRYFDVCC